MIAEKEFLSPGVPGRGDEDPATPTPLQIPQGGGPYLVGRSHRRRRSAGLLPPPVPAEMPVDTAGRVVFLSTAPPPDVRPEPPGGPGDAAAPPAAPAPVTARVEGWAAVALAAALILAVFLVGLVLFR